MIMTHPGLPENWAWLVMAGMLVGGIWLLLASVPKSPRMRVISLASVPLLGPVVRKLAASRGVLLLLKVLTVLVFLLVIVAGLFGTPIPERNLATLLTWNLWWSGLILSVFFLGSAWCAICPWDTLAQWLVRHRLWKRVDSGSSLNLRVPRWLASVWPALFLFVALTWLELGVGITTSPYATAGIALLMVVLATASLALFQRKAFCRYFCPVGRTIGFYSQLSLLELRPIDGDTCARCTTLECYHGSDTIEPCPTWLVMGRMQQNTYCLSCGNCGQSCPQQNVAWRIRPPSVEALHSARPHWDEAWFMIGLLALTGFHGLTMMPFWETWMRKLAQVIGDSGQLLWSFSIGLVAVMAIIAALYAATIAITKAISHSRLDFKRLFSTFAFVALPLAFAYHMAHNLNHLVREGSGIGAVFANPLGIDTAPLSMMEKHARSMHMWLSQDTLFALQALLMLLGFWIAVQVIRYRGGALLEPGSRWSRLRLLPLLGFAIGITGFHLWLLMQPMIMRM